MTCYGQRHQRHDEFFTRYVTLWDCFVHEEIYAVVIQMYVCMYLHISVLNTNERRMMTESDKTYFSKWDPSSCHPNFFIIG